jgi:hypothetical protein
MQRKKVYNLHTIAYFIAALFVLKMDKILSDQISTVRKWHSFLVPDEFVFFLFLSNKISNNNKQLLKIPRKVRGM